MFPRILSKTHLARTWLAVIVLFHTLEAAVMLPGIAQTSVPSQQRSTPEATQELIINGVLNQNSEQLEKDGSYIQKHTFAGRAGEAITIELSSSEFDAYLILIDPNSKEIAKNDDGGEGSNAKITITLTTTGTYTVLVNTNQKGEQGSYKLSWREASAQEQSLAEATELNQRGIELYKQGKYDEAVPLLEESLAVRKQVLGDEHPDVALSLNNLAFLYKSQGRLQEAEPLYQQALDMRQKFQGAEHPDVATSLNNLAALYEFQGRYTEAEPLLKQALEMRQKLLGAEHLDVATSLNNLAFLYSSQGRLKEAEPLYQQALEMLKKLMGAEHPSVATSLNNLAGLYESQGRYAEAESLFKQALEIRQKLLGAEHPYVAQSLNNLAVLYESQGRLKEAEPLYQQALEMLKKLMGVEHPSVATSLNNLAVLYESQGRYAEAESLFKQALEMRQKLLGAEHPYVAQSLNNLAELYKSQGRYTEAEPLYKQALEMEKKLLGAEHPSVATSLNNLAVLYEFQGRYTEAEPLFKQALEMRQKLLGAEHLDVAASLNSLAVLYESQGRYTEAEPLMKQGLEIYKKLLGVEHPSVATNLNNLAALYKLQGRYTEAEPLMKQGLEMYKKLLGAEHPSVATSLNNLAELYKFQGRYTEAEPLYKQALEMYKKLLGAEHPSVATSLNNLAGLYESQGRYTEAEPLYKQALEMRQKLLGAEHPSVATSLNNLAGLYESQGNVASALQFLERGLEVQEKNLTRNLVAGSEPQKQEYLKTISGAKDGVISLHLQKAPDHPTTATLAFTTILRRKGRLLDFLTINQQLLRQQLDSQGQEWLEKLNTIYSQLSTLLYNQPKYLSPAASRKRFADLQQQAKDLENEISRRHNSFWEVTQPVTIEDIQQLIPVNAALVEFVQYDPFDAKTKKWGEPRYGVYVLTSEGEPQGMDLGTVEEIESAMQLFRLSLRDKDTPQQQLKDAARQLDKMLMQRVRQLLGSKQQILISPDSNLNLIPFEALVDENNRYLVETYRFTYLSSGRDLRQFTSTSVKRSKKSVLLGNPNFSDKGDVAIKRDFDVSEWILGRLPGTEEEVKAIGELLGVEPLLGTAATEAAVKQVESPFILHIATHGFFETTKTPDDAPTVDSNSLLRSGLVLAGFKQEQTVGENGLLTALEATGLNLSGTELVVLSACDTGLGGISPGEGIYGLRRAFAIAGSQSQLISLWKVDDEATKELMVKYYERLLEQKMGRTEALRKTQLEMLRGETETDYSHPYYWASFIPSGNWEPIDGSVGVISSPVCDSFGLSKP